MSCCECVEGHGCEGSAQYFSWPDVRVWYDKYQAYLPALRRDLFCADSVDYLPEDSEDYCETSGYRSFGRVARVDGHTARQEYCLKPWYLDRDCDIQQYHKLSFIHTYRKLRVGLNKAEWADNDNPSGLPTSEEYQKAIQCYLSLYTFDNTNEPFYYRVLTGQYGKRSHKAYHAIATYLERKG